MVIWLSLALIFAVLEAIAVLRNSLRLEYIAKPTIMVCLFFWLYTRTGLQGNTFWFGAGILLSFAGDVLLMFPAEKLFLFGLIAFLFAHISYITGFRDEPRALEVWTLILAILITVNTGGLLRRIIHAMRANGQNKLVFPVIVYGIIISVMLYAALSTLYDPGWKTGAAVFVSVGAFLFSASDTILAWNKFVFPLENGRIWNIVLYYLGQIGIISGVIIQFS
jgi:uncharacterized membrane protein YhhN